MIDDDEDWIGSGDQDWNRPPAFCHDCGAPTVWGVCPNTPHDVPWPVDSEPTGCSPEPLDAP